MRIATKKGDKGQSCLLTGKCLSKGDLMFDVLGDLDELNSFLGWAKVAVKDQEEWAKTLDQVQEDIYRMMSVIGNEMQAPNGIRMIEMKDVEFLEEKLEKVEEEVGVLTKFIKPGVNEVSSRFHVARSICRRAERKTVMKMEELSIPEILIAYLNRLSDLLFILAYKFDKMQPL